jgi:hypothetical protein
MQPDAVLHIITLNLLSGAEGAQWILLVVPTGGRVYAHRFGGKFHHSHQRLRWTVQMIVLNRMTYRFQMSTDLSDAQICIPHTQP